MKTSSEPGYDCRLLQNVRTVVGRLNGPVVTERIAGPIGFAGSAVDVRSKPSFVAEFAKIQTLWHPLGGGLNSGEFSYTVCRIAAIALHFAL